MPSHNPAKPLSHIRVLDLTNVLSGPFCCHQLAHLGADVIKVELPKTGDLARQLGLDPQLNNRLMGASFLAQNAGKRSITLNLKHPKGQSIFKQLVQQADVLVENFRPRVMDKLGLGFADLKSLNPQLIYCAISGFGASGELKNSPAYDQIIQGLSGIMQITGEGENTYRVGYPICDTVGGLTAAMAINAALAAPSRQATFIDISMLESTLVTMGWAISNYLIAGVEPQAHGNENMTSAPSGTFATQDQPINIAANKEEQWQQLCQHLQRSDLVTHPQFSDREARKKHRQALKTELEKSLIQKPAHVWVAELNALNIPAGAVLSLPEALTQPQVQSRQLLSEFQQVAGVERDITVVKTGMQFNGQPLSVDNPPPTLGQHQAEIFNELGITEDLADLHEQGVI